MVSLKEIWLGRIRRGGYIFYSWIGDHPPRHVHIVEDGRLIAKVELNDNLRVMQGMISNRIRRILSELIKEGLVK